MAALTKLILIETQWNLKSNSLHSSKVCANYINRNTVEFKVGNDKVANHIPVDINRNTVEFKDACGYFRWRG